MPTPQAKSLSRRILMIVLVVVSLVAIGVASASYIALHRAGPILKGRVIQTLETYFNSKVELETFDVSVLNGLEVSGTNLRIYAPDDVVAAGEDEAGVGRGGQEPEAGSGTGDEPDPPDFGRAGQGALVTVADPLHGPPAFSGDGPEYENPEYDVSPRKLRRVRSLGSFLPRADAVSIGRGGTCG